MEDQGQNKVCVSHLHRSNRLLVSCKQTLQYQYGRFGGEATTKCYTSIIFKEKNLSISRPLFEAMECSMSNKEYVAHLQSQLTIYGCSNVSTTLGESCENVGKTTLGESSENVGKIKLLQHIPGKFLKSCHNVTAKSCRKTSPQHYGNIHSFRQSVTIFTMLWQPFCNMGTSA